MKAAKLIEGFTEASLGGIKAIVKKVGGTYQGGKLFVDPAYGKRYAELFYLPQPEAEYFEQALQDMAISYHTEKQAKGFVYVLFI